MQNVFIITKSFLQLFGWVLESLLLTTHQKRCQAFFSAGKLDEALKAHKYMMDAIDDIAKASCLDWCNRNSRINAARSLRITTVFLIQRSPGKMTMAMMQSPISSTKCINIFRFPGQDFNSELGALGVQKD
ncbi:hypothetical protein C8R48DRAFT_107943 [Suillus tomentosus]|nr:hypothetical protein C8R48DRAFT_107943 [Suillus tomentosus]